MKRTRKALSASFIASLFFASLSGIYAQDVDVTVTTDRKATIIHKDGETEEIEVIGDDGDGKTVQSFQFKSVTGDIWNQIEEHLEDSGLDQETLEKIEKAVAKATERGTKHGILGSGIIIDADGTHEAIERIKKLSRKQTEQWIGELPFDSLPASDSLHEILQGPHQSGHIIGVQCTKVSDAMRAQLDIEDGQGLVVQRVFDDTPAKAAGITKHDILLTANAAILGSVQELIDAVDDSGKEGDSVNLTLLRKGKNQTVSVTPEKRPKRTENVVKEVFTELTQKHNVDDSKIEKLQEQIDSLSKIVAELSKKLEDR